ncbi:MAG: hypothetical protein AAF449_04535 [Myxococcota bacterium]
MERQRPDTSSNEIELYIRTYYSLLRSNSDIRVRSLEEAHLFSDSSLHLNARESEPDLSAFGYAAARLPSCMPDVQKVVLGQSTEAFQNTGLDVESWPRVSAPGRRRPMKYDGAGTLALFIASASDIDDVVPIVTAYQIEWNKVHVNIASGSANAETDDAWADWLRAPVDAVASLRRAFGEEPLRRLFGEMKNRRLDLRLRLLAGSFSQYQRAAERWWRGIEPVYRPSEATTPRPIYFVSSNTHALVNLLGGYALAHQDDVLRSAQQDNPERVWPALQTALQENTGDLPNLLNFCLRHYIRRTPGTRGAVAAWDAQSGITTVRDPGEVEVAAQVFELSKLKPDRLDPRLSMPGLERLAASDAVIINIDYPLGMAAYQLLSRVGQGAKEIRAVYVMGKAATLNGRVGDVMLSKVVHDEHSKNSYLYRNAFSATDVEPYLLHGTVLDNQKALTVRSAFLQNRSYMGVFYREGYTVLEMEAGPYLSAVYELVDPRRHPRDEIVSLGERAPFPIGILHYASDTPYSRRQELLSKSLGFFGMDATYACAIAIVRRILASEVERTSPVASAGRESPAKTDRP